MKLRNQVVTTAVLTAGALLASVASAQLRDVTQNTDIVGVPGHPGDSAGIGRAFSGGPATQAGASPDDHGDVNTPNTSAYFISRDPGRAIRRGRQIFQRKFQIAQGNGPTTDDGQGSTGADLSRSAGFADSCAACHGRPRGSAGFGGDVVTRPDSRDAPHLFGLGLQEQLGEEITADLRAQRAAGLARAAATNRRVRVNLRSKGIKYGSLVAFPNGTVDTSGVQGVNPDLRVRPFFAQGATVSIREFLVGAFNAEMGLESPDIDLAAALSGPVTTPSGMELDGTVDIVEGPTAASTVSDGDGDGVVNEIPTSIVDFEEFYLLHYFKAGTGQGSKEAQLGLATLKAIGCTSCHIQNLKIDSDRRVADLETVYNPVQGNPFNNMFATATLFVAPDPDVPGVDVDMDGDINGMEGDDPPGLVATGGSFLVRNFFADLKRHDLGPNFHERNFVNFVAQVAPGADPPLDPATNFNVLFITEPLWGVGDTPSYGHDGRSGNLDDVILRHGGEALQARNRFARLRPAAQGWIKAFLRTLVLFGPDDTASNLRPTVPSDPLYPQVNHGSIALGAIFTTPGGE